MSNSLSDLHKHLFSQLDRLDGVSGDELEEELKRTKAMTDVSKTIINNAKLVLDAQKFKDDKWDAEAEIPKMLE